MEKLPRLIVAIGLWTASTLAVPASVHALANGEVSACQLGGGNGILLTFQLSQQGNTLP
jgi:hypothetical protein